MKKIVLVLFSCLIFMAYSEVCLADNQKLTIKGISVEDNVLKVNIISSGGNCTDFLGTLDYDKEKLEFVSATGLNDFHVTSGGNLLIERDTPLNEAAPIAELKFRILDNSSDVLTTIITFNNVKYVHITPTSSGTVSTQDLEIAKSGSEITVVGVDDGKVSTNEVTTKEIVEPTPETGDVEVYLIGALLVVGGLVFLKRKYA